MHTRTRKVSPQSFSNTTVAFSDVDDSWKKKKKGKPTMPEIASIVDLRGQQLYTDHTMPVSLPIVAPDSMLLTTMSELAQPTCST